MAHFRYKLRVHFSFHSIYVILMGLRLAGLRAAGAPLPFVLCYASSQRAHCSLSLPNKATSSATCVFIRPTCLTLSLNKKLKQLRHAIFIGSVSVFTNQGDFEKNSCTAGKKKKKLLQSYLIIPGGGGGGALQNPSKTATVLDNLQASEPL